tara:strand:+ start:441 stop:1145 length:705 start_codon:yes stop_codon:yes gene_type:complete
MNEAIILAGGLGTRLSKHVPNIPKPMAPINGKPFLDILIKNLSNHGFTKVILSVGHMAESIQNYFGNKIHNVDISYNVEKKPLGTGGAIFSSLKQCNSEYVFVLNGDTFLNINFSLLNEYWKKNRTPIIVTREVLYNSRYGSIEVEKNTIKKFNSPQKKNSKCLINAGIYLLPKSIKNTLQGEVPFSFETDYLQTAVNSINFLSYQSNDYFIDIGIPQDYERAQIELLKNLNEI